jgi:glycosyltransferase involved in cell wall biosynthesis
MTPPPPPQPRPAGTVLFLVDGLGVSGKTKALADLACGLDPRRYRAEVCCFAREESPLADRMEARGIPVLEVPCPDGLHWGMVGRLARLMRRVRPAVVHCYNPRTILYGGLAAKLVGVRGTVGSLSAFACQVPDHQYSHLPQPLLTASWRNRLRNRLIVRLVRYLVVVSYPLGERFFRYNGLAPDKLRVVPYGVDMSRWGRPPEEELSRRRQELGIPPGAVAVGAVGRLVEQKDYPTLFRALALAAAQVPALHSVVVGDGPLRRPLEQMAGDLGMADRLHFLGHRNEVAPILHCLDIFALTSVFEPFGVALLEAKAAGLPIVATKVNEVEQIVHDGRSGLLVPSGDPARLADVLVRLARDPALRQRLGQTALEESWREHRLETVVAEYQALYDAARGLPPVG